jgi:non-ribosomal peptide synthetase component F
MRLERSKFDLAVFLVETEKGLVGHWVYATDLFDSATIERMAGHYQTLLTSILAQPEAPLSTLVEVLAEADKQRKAVEEQEFEAASRRRLKEIKRRTTTGAEK